MDKQAYPIERGKYMVRLLAKMFIKDYKNYEDINVRERYGILSGCVGILLNAMLFGIKFLQVDEPFDCDHSRCL